MLRSEIICLVLIIVRNVNAPVRIGFLSPPHHIISPRISLEQMFNGAQHWRWSLVGLNYAVAAIRCRILYDDIYKYKEPSFAKSCLFLFVINWITREKTSYFFQVYYENRSFRHVALLGLLCHFVWRLRFCSDTSYCVRQAWSVTASRVMLFPTALVSDYSAEIVIRDVTDVLWPLRDYFGPFRDDTDV